MPDENNLAGLMVQKIEKLLADLPLTNEERRDADSFGQVLFERACELRRKMGNDDYRSTLVMTAALAVATILQETRARQYELAENGKGDKRGSP